ncbi:MAG: stage II sporulation protein M [Planctomycetes bacterium]|nr:stage II sporulation protein M [Planctomycetota bacterium]
MNEKTFAEQRKEQWVRLEELLEEYESDSDFEEEQVEELLSLYRRASHDLAEAQTHFPDSPHRQRLELLVGRAYGAVYGRSRSDFGLGAVIFRKIPRAFRRNVGYFLFAFGFFALGCVLGVLLVNIDERWAELYMPSSAIDGVRRGRLWTDFFSMVPASVASAAIFYNNALVCFSAFGLGIVFGVGTIYILFSNGLMLGSATALCWKYNLLGELMGFVIGHGVLEVSAILLASAGGVILGDSLVRPGPYTRLASLRMRSRDAALLALGAVPFLVLAGFLEGFVSPGSASYLVKYGVGIGAGILLYFFLCLSGRKNISSGNEGESAFAGNSPQNET